jgi:hypothetical protein
MKKQRRKKTANNIPRALVDETHKEITQIGSGIWTTVYRRVENHGGTIIAALIPEAKVKHILTIDDWGFDPRALRPGCTKFSDGRVVYYRFGSDKGYEPLILEREFGGIRSESRELSEEFRLFHNLCFDAINNKYVKISDDGSEQDTVVISPDRITIRTVELKQFLAIKEMRLVVLFDVRRHYPARLDAIGSAKESNIVQDQRTRYRYVIADSDFGGGSVVRIWGKILIQGYSKEQSGIWPFENGHQDDKDYIEFIIGIDKKGKNRTAPCDPHGGRYLTPVYFRPEVLNKYHDNPSKYSVEDGYLRCGSLWGLQIHNDRPDYVTAYLGDLGRDLPESERSYWRSFNIPPAGPMSETAYKRTILAEFSDATKRDLVFKQEFESFGEFWEKKYGWPLFKRLSKADSHCMASLRIPTTSEQGEFDTQVLFLAKILIDSLNESEITKEITGAPNQKGIGKLEEYLRQRGLPEVDKHIQFLRDLQSIRSTGTAHRKSENYEKVARRIGLDTKDRRQAYTAFLDSAIELLTALRTI